METHAVIELSGKQFRVKAGDVIVVDSALGKQGEELVADKVLAVESADGTRIGQPYLEGAQVVLEVLELGKSRKITAFKYKRRNKSTRRRLGHRQDVTRLLIREIKGV